MSSPFGGSKTSDLVSSEADQAASSNNIPDPHVPGGPNLLTSSEPSLSGSVLIASYTAFPREAEARWDETTESRWRELLALRTSGTATARDNAEFDKLQEIRRSHAAMEEETDFPAKWAKLQHDKKILELLREYADWSSSD